MPIQVPLLEPDSQWAPPDFLPDIADAEIAIDLETKDPDLRTLGPSWHRGGGEVIGIAISSKTFTGYLPIAHLHGDNLDKVLVVDYVKYITSDPSKTYIFHNAPYDLGWLRTLGIKPQGRIVDTMVTESLINEERPSGYSLDALSRSYLNRPKDETILREAAQAYNCDPKSEMWRLPARFVGPYAEVDAINTLAVYGKQQPYIGKDNLQRVFDLECEVTPIIVEMNQLGIPVDLVAAEQLNDEWTRQEKGLLQKVGNVDIWSTVQIAHLLDKEGIKYPLTEKGNPSITKQFLETYGQTNRTLRALREVRELNRLRNVFVYEGIIKGNVRGRVYPNFIQVASEDGGTRTGRFACRNPNIQQIPKRSQLIDAKRIRSLYKADTEVLWASLDYSSQEPRMQVHYGIKHEIKSAEEAKEAFEKGIKLYTFIEQKCPGINYDQAKAVMLGRSYGMGFRTMAETIGVSEEECRSILDSFDTYCPFISQLAERASQHAQRNGYVCSIYGRRRRFNYWAQEGNRDSKPVYSAERAREAYGKYIERIGTHKAFNAVIQGSCADQTKQAMVNIYKEGIVPYSQVHDEINCPVVDEKQANLCKEIMENAISLNLPTVADLDIGEHW